MKLRNEQTGMEIGICKFNNMPALYIQEGKCSRIYATFLSEGKAEMFLHKIMHWDYAGGNDGGIEK